MVSTDNGNVMARNRMVSTDNSIVMSHKPMLSTDKSKGSNRNRMLSLDRGNVTHGDRIVSDCTHFVSIDQASDWVNPLTANSQRGSRLPSSRGDAVRGVLGAMLFVPLAEPWHDSSPV
jgi:hypothetical protein